MTAYDVAAKRATAQRSFDPRKAGATATVSCAHNDMTGRVARQMFDLDYTRMAATVDGAAPTTHNIGFVAHDGRFTNLSLASAGSRKGVDHFNPVFSPYDGRLWYQADRADRGFEFRSVQPDNPAGDRAERRADEGANRFYLTAGNRPTSVDGAIQNVVAPDGRTLTYNGSGGLAIRQPGSPDTAVYRWSATDVICVPVVMLDAGNALCVGRTEPALLQVSLTPAAMTQKRLTAKAPGPIVDALAGSAGRIAFIAEASAGSSLYTVPATGGEPELVAGIPYAPGQKTMLVEWRP